MKKNRLYEDTDQNQYFEESSYQEQKLNKSKYKNALLGASLGWFCYALFIALISSITAIYFYESFIFLLNKFILLFLIPMIVIGIVELFWGPKINFWVQIILITVLMICIGILVLSFALIELIKLLSASTINDESGYLLIVKTMAVILAPTFLLAVLSIFIYFNLFKQKILWAFLTAFLLSLLAIFLASFFIWNSILAGIYSALSLALVSLYLAIDWFVIIKTNEAYSKLTQHNKSTDKFFRQTTIYFGFKLAYDYILVLIYLIRLLKYISWAKN
ncbi:MAG0110 family membrane protein [Mycoplasmopsis primatum]|uniref:MAG0110 family membrane protein n=1 Tax=Mycoplasmopsis primatum TaxID=55604 RepID=UPI000495BEFD|nr:hypothetical protein [Mycoplasmopsis primatum]